MTPRFPTALRKKATIGIVSPASPQRDMSRLDKGIRYLEGLGYTVVVGDHARSRYAGYLAGSDAERLSDIHGMFADKRIDAIFCARGGYGSARLLNQLDYGLILKPLAILWFGSERQSEAIISNIFCCIRQNTSELEVLM